jgi:hypothetical protein
MYSDMGHTELQLYFVCSFISNPTYFITLDVRLCAIQISYVKTEGTVTGWLAVLHHVLEVTHSLLGYETA